MLAKKKCGKGGLGGPHDGDWAAVIQDGSDGSQLPPTPIFFLAPKNQLVGLCFFARFFFGGIFPVTTSELEIPVSAFFLV